MKKTNFEVNGNKYYRTSRVVGHKADGTPIRKFFFGKGQKEAEDKAQEYMNKLSNGYSNDFDKVTVIELLKTWLFNVKLVSVKPSTFTAYEGNYRLYISTSPIATMKVSAVKKIHIQTFYNELFEKHSTEKVKAVHKLLHSFFEYAVDEGYLIKNPCHKVVIPKNTIQKDQDTKLDIFSLDEINYIKNKFKRK